MGMWKKQIMAARSGSRTREQRAAQKRHHQYHFLDLSNPENIDMSNVVYPDFRPPKK